MKLDLDFSGELVNLDWVRVPNGVEVALPDGEVVFVPEYDFVKLFAFSPTSDEQAAVAFGRARLRADPGHVGADGLYVAGAPPVLIRLRVGNIPLAAPVEELPDVIRAIPSDWDVVMPAIDLLYLIGLKLI